MKKNNKQYSILIQQLFTIKKLYKIYNRFNYNANVIQPKKKSYSKKFVR